ncbi:precorrin-3B synthase [Mycolicibacterium sp. P9-22]|uniref:precorrin-3B synthase n=1 Tax=Mycolicibacterium sp. P9-22 TaxID=2024613 RepID=UPI0011EE6DF2|nr:precorrin-3B synthase [Mycolicibacterium sp. P9-22]KAA0112787.1 precorrin-3B synthase [Mycolicibacterium sp. P9-22]
MSRTRDQDACPGALQVHQAADGALIRIRLPGGFLPATALETLAHLAADSGGGALELTSRGSLQIRGITDPSRVAEALAGAGLLPSRTHERVRNIVSSPLSGRSGGRADVRGWVGELDAALQQDAALAALPGRFWFSVDDGRGDVSGLRADIGVQPGDTGVALLLAGADTGIRVSADDAVGTMVEIARRFQAVRGKRWRVTELDDPSELIDDFTVTAPDSAGRYPHDTGGPPVGWIPQTRDPVPDRVALGAAVPLGVLPARTAEFLAAIEAPVVVTPWRSILVCDLTEEVADTSLRVLAPLGLVFDENSPWLTVSACTGSPGCDKSLSDVRADARAALTEGRPGVHRHFVGCPRACGSPRGAEVLVATGHGYEGRHP